MVYRWSAQAVAERWRCPPYGQGLATQCRDLACPLRIVRWSHFTPPKVGGCVAPPIGCKVANGQGPAVLARKRVSLRRLAPRHELLTCGSEAEGEVVPPGTTVTHRNPLVLLPPAPLVSVEDQCPRAEGLSCSTQSLWSARGRSSAPAHAARHSWAGSLPSGRSAHFVSH